ncbi:MAG: single-stranded DNA-binding protein [Acidimicrobiia bacterium]|nr:single-stranded DNA-binding protein [Acidimicrobiia bacterium]NNC42032.1 single-stranded DNA-binding protein [Acidimicrobiia bacterium]NND13858.1 single-stranded DNA-binding protein [Acidimicrobiia bacterium]
MDRTSIPEDDLSFDDEDVNIVVLRGNVVAEPEIRHFDSGAVMIRYLTTVRVTVPKRRLDVIPVTLWDPPEDLMRRPGTSHDRIWVLGSVQRRFWPMASHDRRRSRIEVVANRIDIGAAGDFQLPFPAQ